MPNNPKWLLIANESRAKGSAVSEIYIDFKHKTEMEPGVNGYIHSLDATPLQVADALEILAHYIRALPNADSLSYVDFDEGKLFSGS